MKWQSVEDKIDEIYKLYNSGLYKSQHFCKYIRIPLTEQASLRKLDEKTLRSLYHYCSSDERCENRSARSVEEHVVPIRTIISILTNQYENNREQFTRQFIKEVLEKCLWIVFITSEENKKLNAVHLRHSMPNGWDWKRDSPFIRYEIAGIKVSWPSL